MKKLIIGLFIFVSLTLGVQVYAESLPDLIVQDFSWYPLYPTATYTSDVTTLSGYIHGSVTIQNIGNLSVTLPEGMNVYLYKSDETNIVGGFSLGTEVTTLFSGDSKTYSFTSTAGPNITETPGTFNLTMRVDDPQINTNSFGLVRESNEGNNTLIKQITILDDSDGCYGARYSATTGKACPLSMVTEEGCFSGLIFSSTTGQRCNSTNNTTPSITILSPNGGETYTAGQQITVRWNSQNLPSDAKIRVVLSAPYDLISSYNPSTYYVSNTGSTTFTLPTDSDFIEGHPSPWGKSFQFIVSTPMSNSTGALALDLTDDTFTINRAATVIDNGCAYGAIYSSTTGARCSSITRVDSSCKVGTLYSSITGKLCPLDTTRVRITRTLRWGTKGDDVKILQRYFGLDADGVYGRGTVAKVKEWQTLKGLNPDGTFGYYSRVKAGLE